MPDIVGSHNGSQVFLKVVVLPVEDGSYAPDGSSEFPKLHVFDALVDTGAQGTRITRRAALRLGLKPIGLIPVQGVSGIQYHNNYLFQIGFADIQRHEIGFARRCTSSRSRSKAPSSTAAMRTSTSCLA